MALSSELSICGKLFSQCLQGVGAELPEPPVPWSTARHNLAVLCHMLQNAAEAQEPCAVQQLVQAA